MRLADDGNISIDCKAGCKHSAVLSALNLQFTDLKGPNKRFPNRVAEVYDYVDAAGTSAQKVRRSDKSLLWRHQNGNGKCTWKKGSAEPALYRERRIRAKAEGLVYVVEGENNAIRAIDTVRGTVRTVAGAGPTRHEYARDGVSAIGAPLWQLHGVCVSRNRSLVFSDTINHRVRRLAPVRRVP